MSEFRKVRTCSICSEKNPAVASACRICGEDLRDVEPDIVERRERRLLGVPERAILGAGAGVFIGVLLQPREPFVGRVLRLTANADDGLDQLMVPLTHQSFILILMCGIAVAGLVVLASLANGSGIRALALAPARRWPCPHCAEMIQSQAKICRHCNRAVQWEASELAVYGGRG